MLVRIALDAGHPEIIIAAKIDIIIGRILVLVDIDVFFGQIGCFDLSTGSGVHA
jgi:hypothetical protein